MTEPGESGTTKQDLRWLHQSMLTINYSAAFATLLGFLKDWKSTVSFIIGNLTLAGVSLLALATLFAAFLLSSARAKRKKTERRESHAHRQPWRLGGKRGLRVAGAIITVMALGVVVATLYKVYLGGIYYVILESSTNEVAVVERVEELNRLLETSGVADLRVGMQEPIGRSEHFAITVGGPFLRREAAESAFATIKILLGTQVRADAGVRKITIKNVIAKYACRFKLMPAEDLTLAASADTAFGLSS